MSRAEDLAVRERLRDTYRVSVARAISDLAREIGSAAWRIIIRTSEDSAIDALRTLSLLSTDDEAWRSAACVIFLRIRSSNRHTILRLGGLVDLYVTGAMSADRTVASNGRNACLIGLLETVRLLRLLLGRFERLA